MSSFNFTRVVADLKDKAHTATIGEGDDAVTFRLKPKIGARALEAIGRADNDDLSGVFDALRALMLDDGFERFMELDLDAEEELPEFFGQVMELYEGGKSSGSPAPAGTAGTS